MNAWLLSRHGKARNGYHFTDAGLDVCNVYSLMNNEHAETTIIGLVWRYEEGSPYILKVTRFGRTHFLAIPTEKD